MSASPSRFGLVPHNPKADLQLSYEDQLTQANVLARLDEAVDFGKRWRAYSILGILFTFVAGMLAGYFLYLIWEQVSLHEAELTRQRLAIQGLTANGVAVSNQVSRLRAIDNNVDSLRALFDAQTERLAQLEKGQNGMKNQMVGMKDQMSGINNRWQRLRELDRAKMPVTMAPPAGPAVGRTEFSSSASVTPTPSTQQSTEKHNETFSTDLKPMPNAYAQMSPSGLVVWMTPRPGFAKPVPTSVIGHVRGLGMLVHDWDDNNHYFITESGSWIVDQR